MSFTNDSDSNTASTKVAVVILNWNGIDLLKRFLPSVTAHSVADHISVWIADNGSTDGSVKFLKDHFPEVGLLEFDRNYGFAGGYNKAFAEINAGYYILLNSDVEVTRGWTEHLLGMMESDDSVAACMPKIKETGRRDYFEYAGAAGGYIDFLGYPFCRGRIFDIPETDHGQYDDSREIFWVSGACMMVRGVDWHGEGGFDERFFAHMEEIDLCWRLKNRGKKIMVCPSSVVYHLGGGSLPRYHPRKTFLNYRNNLLMMIRNLPAGRLYLVFVRMLFDWLSVMKFTASFSFVNAFAVIRAHFAFFRLLPAFIRERLDLPPKSKGIKHKEIYPRSIVIDFFVRRKKFFSELDI